MLMECEMWSDNWSVLVEYEKETTKIGEKNVYKK